MIPSDLTTTGNETPAFPQLVGRFHLWIDEPHEWKPKRFLRISGWCMSKSGPPVAIRARLRGQIFDGRFNVERPDVAEYLGLTNQNPRCGFTIDLKVPAGKGRLQLQVSRDGKQWANIYSRDVRGPIFASATDRAERQTRREADARSIAFWFHPPAETWPRKFRYLRLEGWCFALAENAITAIRARVGAQIFPAHYGILRPDVSVAYERRPGSLRSGFALDAIVPFGRHELILEARGSDGYWQEFFAQRVTGPLVGRRQEDISSPIGNYPAWIRFYDTLTGNDRRLIRRELAQMQRPPKFSVLLPVYNSDPTFLRRAIESVRQQLYSNWELCVVDDASSDACTWSLLQSYARRDPRIKIKRRAENGHICTASNDALALATGDYVALFDHDDELAPTALFCAAQELNREPRAHLLYSDEDKLDRSGRRYDPHFKPDWNPDLFLSQNYISHLGIFSTELVRRVGGFRLGFEGAQDYDLTLRCLEQIDPAQISHIPHVLYHWRSTEKSTAASLSAKPYAPQAAIRAVQEHLNRRGIAARVEPHHGIYQRVIYPIPPDEPLVSVVIPTRDRGSLLRGCIESIRSKTEYRNFEIIVLDNESSEPDALEFLGSLSQDDRIRVLRVERPFNFSYLHNLGVAEARGTFVCLLNNDLEVKNSGWLTEMLREAARPEIGAVGARLWYPSETLQHAGVILGGGGIGSHAHAGLTTEDGYFSRAQLTQDFSAVTAACMLLRREVYLQLGGLDEMNLPVAFNDVDFCLRLQRAGLRVVWTPFAELYHHESASRGFEDTAEKRTRFLTEAEYMERTWREQLQHDPAYNPNLSLGDRLFTLAFPPRVTKPWLSPNLSDAGADRFFRT